MHVTLCFFYNKVYYFMGCEIDTEVSIWFRPPKNLFWSISEKDLLFTCPHFHFRSEHCCGNKRSKFIENHRCRAGSLFALTVAASAGLPVPISAAQLLYPVLWFPFLLEKILLAFSGAIIDMKHYISLSYQHNDYIFINGPWASLVAQWHEV